LEALQALQASSPEEKEANPEGSIIECSWKLSKQAWKLCFLAQRVAREETTY